MTNPSDTLAALSEAATQGEWELRHDDEIWGNEGHGDIQLVTTHANDARFIAALVNAYRTGQLVPVPSVERVRREAFEEAAKVAYRVCAETRHVSLGEVVATAVIAAMQEGRDG